MKIHALSSDTGGCHYYRLRVPLTELRRRGHETSWGQGIDADDLNRCDVLIGQFLNGPQDLEGWEAIAAAPKRPLLVYETDDDLFTIDEVITAEVTRKQVLWADPETQKRVWRFIELADLVTTTTPALGALYAQHGANVAVLPNAIPDWLLDINHPGPPKKFTVGWTLSHSHLMDAREHVDGLAAFMENTPDAVFGWYGPPKVVGGFTNQIVRPWQGNVNEYLRNMVGQLTVGIAPLGKFAFNLGKSGIKADEYAAWGIPAVVSDFPQYDNVIANVTGYKVTQTYHWNKYLSRLHRNPDLCTSMGAAAKELVAQRTISKRAHLWEQAYERAIDDQPNRR